MLQYQQNVNLNKLKELVKHSYPKSFKEKHRTKWEKVSYSKHRKLSTPRSLVSSQSNQNLHQNMIEEEKPAAMYIKQIEILERKIRALEKENYIVKSKYKALLKQTQGDRNI